MDPLPKITPDFLWSQLRIALIATIAYFVGTGKFTPADATLATTLVTSIGPILIPWGMSVYSNYGTLRVSTSSVAAKVATVENVTDDKSAMKMAVDVHTTGTTP